MMSNKVSFISGNFNIIHAGHIRLFKYAKSISDYLVIGVYSDKKSNEYVYIKEKFRLDAIKQLGLVDKVVLINKSLKSTLKSIKPNFIIKGLEFQNNYNEEEEIIKNFNCEIIFSSGEISFSSSELFNNIHNKKEKIPYEYLQRHQISKNDIHQVLNKFNELKVLTIGDLIIDEYIECNVAGLSRETDSVVYSFSDKKLYLGGSGIIAAHASQVASKSYLISICGNDDEEKFAKKKLSEYGVKNKIFKSSFRKTIKKTRFIDSQNRNLFRLNHLNKIPSSDKMRSDIYSHVSKIIKNFDILILADFNYGLIDEKLISKLLVLARKHNVFVAADSQASSQFGNINKFKDVDLIAPTEYEARSALNDNSSGLIILSEKLRKITHVNNILLTQGKDGVFIHKFNKTKNIHENDTLPPFNNNPIDTSGAGDSMLVAASLAMKIRNNLWEASIIGSLFASIQVSRKGNIPITKKNIENFFKNL